MRMPPILYGTAWKKARTAECVHRALKLGFRGVDTACQPRHYDEPGVGEGVALFLNDAAACGLTREDLWLQTKFTPVGGQAPEGIPYDPNAPLAEQVAESFRASLRHLRTTYVDCLILHSPLRREEESFEVWRAMQKVADGGGARRLGLSNCYDFSQFERFYNAARVKPAVLQNRFYADSGYDRELRAFCAAEGIVYQSFWTLSANPRVLESEAVVTLAQRYGRTPAQILFRYLTQEGVAPLTGTTSEQHMQEDLAIASFELTADERSLMGALFGPY